MNEVTTAAVTDSPVEERESGLSSDQVQQMIEEKVRQKTEDRTAVVIQHINECQGVSIGDKRLQYLGPNRPDYAVTVRKTESMVSINGSNHMIRNHNGLEFAKAEMDYPLLDLIVHLKEGIISVYHFETAKDKVAHRPVHIELPGWYMFRSSRTGSVSEEDLVSSLKRPLSFD